MINKNPYLNAVLAAGYIVLLVSIVNKVGQGVQVETILAPMVMLGVLVLSVAVMGFLFVGRPLELFLENKKHEAVKFFGKTIATLAALILIFAGILLYTS